jgi:hypothetical protein
MRKYTDKWYRIRKHGEQLQAIFPATRELDPVELCRKLRRIENKVERHNERICSDEAYCQVMTDEKCEKFDDDILRSLDRLLQFTTAGVPVFLNGDPRGYALKIRSEYVAEKNLNIHRDWGGYGILAPEIK